MPAPNRMEELAAKPDRLLDLTPREFEEVVAELLAAFGWRVSLTPPSRDGGYDILGIHEALPGLDVSWLVECKKYAPDRAISVMLVRELLGVTSHLGIPNGLIVTTARFTRDAQALASQFSGLHLADFDRLSSWLGRYRDLAVHKAYLPAKSFQSCFVSHSSQDTEFVSTLVAALRRQGVPVWFAPEDLLPGEKLSKQIKQAIESFDRLLIVLSEASLQSTWVRTELLEAFRREHTEERPVLFPISLLPFDQLRAWSLSDPDTGLDIAREIRGYFVLDFSQWRDPSAFTASVGRLIKALHHPRDAA